MSSEPTTEKLVFDHCSGTVLVEWLEGDRYRILSPEIAVLTEEYAFGDVVEAFRNDEDALVVKRCLERGNYRTLEYCLPAGWHERENIQEVLSKVQDLGGFWEGIFGGVLIIVLPPEVFYDPTQDITDAMAMP